MSEMAARCTSCGECVRPCAFLQQQGTPATIAKRGDTPDNLCSVFGCSLCGLCDGLCPEVLSPSRLFLGMRQEAVARGLVDLKVYSPWLSYERLGGTPLFRRDYIPEECSTVFFPGCSLAGTRPRTVHGLFERLHQIEPSIGLVLDCCGKISHDLGLEQRFSKLLDRLTRRLRANGISRILTACPGCSKILKDYSGHEFEVVSVYEALAANQQHNLVQPAFPVVTLHDPCPARFDAAQQQSVRKLIESQGYILEELAEHGHTTRCCGQGGMVEGCLPGTVKHESRLIATEAAGRPVISYCASCSETLAAITPTIHVAELLLGNSTFANKPVTSARRWLNRLKLRLARLT